MYTDKVGIEVEIGISNEWESDAEIGSFWRQTYDGSISSRSADQATEFLSTPVDTRNLARLKDNLTVLYQYVQDANSSMGLHVHLSFNEDKHYWALASKEFCDNYIEALKESPMYEGQLKTRIDQSNEYAETVNSIDTVESMLSGRSRYHAVNFASWSEHHTLEFRIFPAYDNVRDIMEAVTFTIDFVEDWVTKFYQDEKNCVKGSPTPKPEVKVHV